MTNLPAISLTEILGRGIFDGERARKAAKGNIHPKIFREKLGVTELSVDRLDHAPSAEVAVLHDGERPEQNFHGWATLSVEAASVMGRTVVANPIDEPPRPPNPYHADIRLPVFNDPEEDAKAHSVNLATASIWRSR